MLAVGMAMGAAIGPTPESSLAGDAGSLAKSLPLLLATAAGRAQAQAALAKATAAAANANAAPGASTTAAHKRRKRRRRHATAVAPASSATTPSGAESPAETSPSTPTRPSATVKKKLPAVSSVWLIELAGGTFTQALAQPSAAPYMDGQLLQGATLLSGWSAPAGSALASEAVLAEPPPPGGAPPLLHSIVQPPCPEGAAGTTCAPETPGQLTAADEFLKATLAQILTTAAYREHGLVVVTFSTVAIASQAGLPAGASSTTLTSQPAGGVLLLSPFARPGSRPSTAFNATSPRQSLEALLHR
jgi:hypothetical protein